MSLHNVTAESFDHHCSALDCTQQREGLAHSEARIVEVLDEKQIQITCPACGSVECLTANLPEWEEISPTRDEASREQIRNNRALHKALGLL